MEHYYHSRGKLLLTGEYVVLDGALALALPTRYGQGLLVNEFNGTALCWKSLDHEGNIWFETVFELAELTKGSPAIPSTDIRETLLRLLQEAITLQPNFLGRVSEKKVTTSLEFPKEWGLGSSSTLINNIAQWAGVNAYTLLWNAFSGSGYDIACAQHDKPLLYQLHDSLPKVTTVAYDPPFAAHLFFVYLNRKQNSREGIARYRGVTFDKPRLIREISEITQAILQSSQLEEFQSLLQKHENLLSDVLQLPGIQELQFQDYPGQIKSLGAWGGDFILAAGPQNTPDYFIAKGFETVIPYRDLIA